MSEDSCSCNSYEDFILHITDSSNKLDHSFITEYNTLQLIITFMSTNSRRLGPERNNFGIFPNINGITYEVVSYFEEQ